MHERVMISFDINILVYATALAPDAGRVISLSVHCERDGVSYCFRRSSPMWRPARQEYQSPVLWRDAVVLAQRAGVRCLLIQFKICKMGSS
jgi:hypothetical protein